MPAADVLANGTATPPPPEDTTTSSLATKRKRADTEEPPQLNGTSLPPTEDADHPPEHAIAQDLLTDILTVLRSHDTSPSILTFRLPNDPKRSSGSDEPSAKRTKLSQEPPASISDKLSDGHYTSLEALVKDVDTVVSELLAPIKAREVNAVPSPYGRPSSLSSHETRLWNKVVAFQKVLDDIVRAEKQRAESKHATNKSAKTPEGDEPTTNGVTVKMEVDDGDMLQKGKTVLTLFANAPGPKQLFSSFQQPVRVNGKTQSKELDASVDIVAPLRESGLPNFIGTTKIPTVQVDDKKSKEKVPKFGDLFAPPSTLPRLQPPKPSKKLTTTGNTISFVPIDKPTRSDRRNSYNWCTARLTVGQWLGYGGVDPPQEPSSPQAKRKQRDRALSTGEAYIPPSAGEKFAQQQAKDDALFRKVYGSFAPSHDDSTAVVPEKTRNEIWWNKVGERYAQRTFAIDPLLLGEDVTESAIEDDEEELKKAVESFDPEKLGLDKLREEAKEAKEVDEILQEVSSLLETLSSYQRIRNSSLATSSRTTVGQNNPLTDLMGSPSTPSTAEMEVYKTLKLQLAVLINSLPPYAVARLNGDQLDELNIKTEIIVETDNTRGVLTEDEASRAAKQQAYAAAAGATPVPQLNRAASSGAYPNYPAAASQLSRTPVAQSAVRPAAPPSYFPQPAPAQARPAPLPYQRSASGVQTYSGGYPTTRPAYPQQNYNQSTPTPRANNYPPSSNHYLQQLQHITGNKPSYNQQLYQNTPQTQRSGFSQTPSTQYQRPQNAAPMYSYPAAQSPQVRTASPLTAGGSVAPSQYTQRPAYGTPQQNSSYYRPPATQSSHHAGTPSSHAPQQARMPVPAMSPVRQASGTPQPPQNGGYSQNQVNGTPMVAQQSS